MPFPLAHPAAVLPLARFCPGRLYLPALVIGSLSPDAGYALARWRMDEFAHSFVGILAFGLPVGLAATWCFQALRPRMACFLPIFAEPKDAQRGWTSFGWVALSVLIGATSHVLWDSFTHKQGWFVDRIPGMMTVVLEVGTRHVRVCHILSVLSSVLGLAVVYDYYLRWLAKRNAAPTPPHSIRWGAAMVASILFLPIQALHYTTAGVPGRALTGLLTFVLVALLSLSPLLLRRFEGKKGCL